MKFDKWLDLFLVEKGIENLVFEIEYNDTVHFVEQDVLITFLKSMPDDLKKKVKSTFVMIDFKNGDCVHYLKHLAESMIAVNFQ